tara:strand:- start:975 stop:1403 length:429 start_codon:yes stop_codon:yes gene_type:complete
MMTSFKIFLVLLISVTSFNMKAQTEVSYEQIDTSSLNELLLLSINDSVKEVYVLENLDDGIEKLSLAALLKIGIQESKIEQRSLTMEEMESLPIEKLLTLDASMKTDQGVVVYELDFSDLSLEEIMSLNAITTKNVRLKKVK